MRDARITPFCFAHWPAHQLNTGVARRRGKLRNFYERKVGQNGADKAEFHEQAPAASKMWLTAISRMSLASQSTPFSSKATRPDGCLARPFRLAQSKFRQ